MSHPRVVLMRKLQDLQQLFEELERYSKRPESEQTEFQTLTLLSRIEKQLTVAIATSQEVET